MRRAASLLVLAALLAPLATAALPIVATPRPAATAGFSLSLFPTALRGDRLPGAVTVSVIVAGGTGPLFHTTITAPKNFRIASANGSATYAMIQNGTWSSDTEGLADQDWAEFVGLRAAGSTADTFTFNLRADTGVPDGDYPFNVQACSLANTNGGCNSAPDDNVSFAIDSVPPTLTFGVNDAVTNSSVWTSGLVNLTWTAGAGPVAFQDNESAILATSPDWRAAPNATRLFQGVDGSRTLHAAVRDLAGNVNMTTASIGFDATKPTVSLLASTSPVVGADGKPWYTSPTTVTVSALDDTSGVASTESRFGSDPWTPVAGAIALPEGASTLSARATDRAGNVGLQSASYQVDTIAPDVLADVPRPSATGWYRSAPTITLAATDAQPGSGVARITYRVLDHGTPVADWKTVAAALAPVKIDFSSAAVDIEYYARDVAGNFAGSAAAPLAVRGLQVDMGAPTVTATLDPPTPRGAHGWYNATAPVATLVANDSMSGVDLRAATGADPLAPYAGPMTLPDGTDGFRYQATDAAGNVAPPNAPGVLSAKVDTIPPTSTARAVTASNLDSWLTDSPTLRVTATDATSGVDRIDAAFNGDPLTPFTSDRPLPDGDAVMIHYRAVDVAGNVEATRDMGPLRVDSRAPDTPTLSGVSPFTGADHLTLGWSAFHSAGPSGFGKTLVERRDASGAWATLQTITDPSVTTYDITALAQGETYAWRVEHVSAAGLASASAVATTTIDLDAPLGVASARGTPGMAGWLVSPDAAAKLDISVGLSGLSNTSAYRLLDGAREVGHGSLVAGTNVIALPDSGGLTLAWSLVDNAGHTSRGQEGYRVDRAPPTGEATIEGAVGTVGAYTSAVNVSFTMTDASSGPGSASVIVDNGTAQTLSRVAIGANGPHEIRWIATDAAGNAEHERVIRFSIDTEAPVTTLSLTSAPTGENGWLLAPVDATLTAVGGISGVAHTEAALDGAAPSAYVAPIRIGPGAHTLSYHSTSGAGLAEVEHVAAILVDLAAPTLDVTVSGSSSGSGWYVAPPTIGLNATDDGVIDRIEYGNGAAWTTATGSVPVAQGVTDLHLRAVDRAGRMSSESLLTVRFDPVVPFVGCSLDGAQSGGQFAGPVQIHIGATSGPSGVAFVGASLDGGTWGLNAVYTVTQPGAHHLDMAAASVAGLLSRAYPCDFVIAQPAPPTAPPGAPPSSPPASAGGGNVNPAPSGSGSDSSSNGDAPAEPAPFTITCEPAQARVATRIQCTPSRSGASWSATDAAGRALAVSPSGSIDAPESVADGPVHVVATIDGASASHDVALVAAPLARIVIEGETLVAPGQSATYTLAGADPFGNPVQLAKTSLPYVAPTEPGPAAVTYEESDVRSELAITVAPADAHANVTASPSATPSGSPIATPTNEKNIIIASTPDSKVGDESTVPAASTGLGAWQATLAVGAIVVVIGGASAFLALRARKP